MRHGYATDNIKIHRKKYGRKLLIGFIWLRIGTSGTAVVNTVMNIQVWRGISLPAERFLASQEEICLLELLSFHRKLGIIPECSGCGYIVDKISSRPTAAFLLPSFPLHYGEKPLSVENGTTS
jgi:hypothetical protein